MPAAPPQLFHTTEEKGTMMLQVKMNMEAGEKAEKERALRVPTTMGSFDLVSNLLLNVNMKTSRPPKQ